LRAALPHDGVSIVGAPPATALVVRNLVDGTEVVRPAAENRTFGSLGWSPSSAEIVIAEREWRDGRFQDARLLRGRRDADFRLQPLDRPPSGRVGDVATCAAITFWVEEDSGGARLRTEAGETEIAGEAGSRMRLLGCIEDRGAA
jgi:hypothetical protein